MARAETDITDRCGTDEGCPGRSRCSAGHPWCPSAGFDPGDAPTFATSFEDPDWIDERKRGAQGDV